MNETFPGSIAAWFFILFIIVWLVVNQLLADQGGWLLLGKRYSASSKPDGPTFRGQVYRVGSVPERNLTTLIASPLGLYLAPFVLFQAGRVPLLIPWRAVTGVVRGTTWWGREWVNLNIDGLTIIQVGSRAFEAMARYVPPPVDAAA